MKICRKCNRELDDLEFSVNRYKKDGSKILKLDCKECLRKNKGDVRVPRKTIGIKEPKEIKSDISFLTVDEVKQVKILLKTINLSVNTLNKANRVPTTINIDKDILKRLKKYSDVNKSSTSDSVNVLLLKILDILQI